MQNTLDTHVHSNRRRFLKSAAVGGLGIVSGCMSQFPGGSDLTTVRVGQNQGNGIQSATAMIASQKGWAEEKGINFEFKTYGIGIDIMRGIAAQEVDFGVDGASWAFLVTASQGQDVGFPSQLWTFDPIAFITPKEITEISHLKGEKVGRIQGSIMDYLTIKVLNENGLSTDEVNLVNMNAASDELAALETGDISGAWLWTRFMDEARKNPDLHALVNGPQVAPLTSKSWGVYTMRNNWAKENVDTAAKCLELVNRATNWLEKNEEQSAELVANEWDLPKEEVLRTSRMVDHYTGIYQKYVDHFKTLHQFGMEHDIMPDFTIEDHILREPAKRAEGVKFQQNPPSDLGDDLPNQPY